MKWSTVYWLIVFLLSYMEQKFKGFLQIRRSVPYHFSLQRQNMKTMPMFHMYMKDRKWESLKNKPKTRNKKKQSQKTVYSEVNNWETTICCSIAKILENQYN